MKTLEIVEKYIMEADMNKNDLKKLVNYAYYLGRHEATRECCKSANKIFREQIQRANNSRFKNFALKIQGNIHTIYHTDYSDDYVKMFNDDFRR